MGKGASNVRAFKDLTRNGKSVVKDTTLDSKAFAQALGIEFNGEDKDGKPTYKWGGVSALTSKGYKRDVDFEVLK